MTVDRPAVLLATFQLAPAGEAGGDLLLAALDARGVDARWAVWDDPAVDWAAADLVAARSTWDYHRRLPAFLEWARRTDAATRLLNGAGTFAWNADKAYLVGLADLVPTVPTRALDDATLRPALAAATADWGTVVVKPATGAGGVGVVVVDSAEDPRLEALTAGPWVAQPLVESVRTEGETSVFVLDDRPVLQVDKLPAGGEVRVHEQYGGTSHAVPLADGPSEVARRAVAAAQQLHGVRLDYARVDLLRHEGEWVVSELELIEPGLYLDVAPEMAEHFAELVAQRLG
ncbi:ATP-grasp domain-containing protein [Nocardioides sp. CPCC 205120]|uniref:ATP-grasp domain-containing protein n=1 Tax=Nocardioides sp. CPCC 205120 TaxID=3406462 RepID=UPI003B506703